MMAPKKQVRPYIARIPKVRKDQRPKVDKYPSVEVEVPKSADELREELKLMEKKIDLQEGLPFLHGWKWYGWAREFFESKTKINLLCAANQISKSSTQIRKCIEWATNEALWPELWKHRPNQFWYLYPTSNQSKIEFETKWKQFLPAGRYKSDPQYGWKEEIRNKELFAIHFNTGVHVYFKSYAQDVQSLQTGTCDALFCDEELPTNLYDELIFRVSSSDGYFHMVFTATLGQEFWRLAMEPGHNEVTTLPEASKWIVSMYDCMKYEDGAPTHWTEEKIQIVKNRCKSHQEILKRVYGRFVMESGRKYEQFDIKRHMRPPSPVPRDWLVYGAADPGSGGDKGHPAAICFVAVSPDFRSGRVFQGWRGDGIPTTASDVVEKFIALKKEYKMVMTAQYYDWASKDFEMISTRMGEPFQAADKSHEKGEQVVNVLFKNNMLLVDETVELQKLAGELSSLSHTGPKNKAKDDFCDALRYAVSRIPWDWSVITGAPPDGYQVPDVLLSPMAREVAERRARFEDKINDQEHARVEAELEEANDSYG